MWDLLQVGQRIPCCCFLPTPSCLLLSFGRFVSRGLCPWSALRSCTTCVCPRYDNPQRPRCAFSRYQGVLAILCSIMVYNLRCSNTFYDYPNFGDSCLECCGMLLQTWLHGYGHTLLPIPSACYLWCRFRPYGFRTPVSA